MARPFVGIYASVVPASYEPWTDRPSVMAPAALVAAVQKAGGIVVLVPPDPDLERCDLLRTLDALIVFDVTGALDHLDVLVDAAREIALDVLVLDMSRVTFASTIEDYTRELQGLFGAR